MLATLGVQGAYAVQAAFLLTALGMTLLIVVSPRTRLVERTPFWQGFMSGVRYVRGDTKLSFILMITLVFSLFGWPWQQLMPAYAREALDASKAQYGILMSCLGAGAMAAAFYITFRVVTQRGRVYVAALVLTGGLLMALGLSSFYPLSLILLFALGASGAVALTLNQTLLQLNSEDAYSGRVISLYLLVFALQPMGTLPAGALADVTGTGWGIFAMGACLVALLAPVLLLSKQLRTF